MTIDDNKLVSAYSMFETVADAETSGVWVPIGPMEFKLARTGGANDTFLKTAAKRLKPFQNALEHMPRKAQDDLAIGIFVDTILMDWKNVAGRDGVEIAYSKEAAKKLLQELPNLFLALQVEANKMSNFSQEALDNAAKN